MPPSQFYYDETVYETKGNTFSLRLLKMKHFLWYNTFGLHGFYAQLI